MGRAVPATLNRTSGICVVRNRPSGSRRYAVVGRGYISHPCQDSSAFCRRCSRYLHKISEPDPSSLVAVAILAIFSLRISSSLTTLSMIFLASSSTTNIFHCKDGQHLLDVEADKAYVASGYVLYGFHDYYAVS